MSVAPDPTLERFVRAIPLTGKPKPRPRVTGAIIITRLSKPKEKMSSLTMQERHCREYVEKTLGVPVLEVFQDIKSGLLKRAGYDEAMRRARMNLCSHIVVYDYDRFSRERVSSLKDYQDLERLGIQMHDTLMGYIDYETAGQKAIDADKEVRKTSRRVTDNMIERAMNKDEYNSPRRAPWGYRKTLEPGKPEKDSDKAKIVEQLFTRFDGGESEGSLCRWFNAVTGRRLRVEGITQMLRNEYYCGVDVYNKSARSKIRGRYRKERDEWCTRYHDQPIIDVDTFQRVQARLDAHEHRGQRRTEPAQYALRGLVLCASCKTRVRGNTDPIRHHVSIVCPLCHRSRTYKRVEVRVQEVMSRIPLNVSDIPKGRSQRDDVVSRVEAITERIERVRKRRGRIINKHEDGEYSEADYRAAMTDTDDELKALHDERDAIVTGAQEEASADMVMHWLGTLTRWTDILDTDPERANARNEIYRQCIQEIHLDYDADVLRVHWVPAIVQHIGQEYTLIGGLRAK